MSVVIKSVPERVQEEELKLLCNDASKRDRGSQRSFREIDGNVCLWTTNPIGRLQEEIVRFRRSLEKCSMVTKMRFEIEKKRRRVFQKKKRRDTTKVSHKRDSRSCSEGSGT